MGAGTLDAWVVIEIVALGKWIAGPGGGHEHDVERTDPAIGPGQPPQHVGVRAAAEAVRPEGEQVGRRAVGQHVGMAGELDHRVRAVVVGRQHVDQAVGRREPPRRGRRQDRGERMR